MAKTPEKNSSLSDEQLVANYKKSGDLRVLGSLYKDYMPLVYGVCLKYFKDTDLSKDAVMQIFEQLVEKLKNHEVNNFKSWLYVLSRNFCLMELRKSKKLNIVNIDDNFVEYAPLLHHDDDGELKEAQLVLMEKCIETLTEEQKWSVKLFYLQQKCYTQVADVTGYDLKKVKSYIQNGKRNLKICIEKNGE